MTVRRPHELHHDQAAQTSRQRLLLGLNRLSEDLLPTGSSARQSILTLRDLAGMSCKLLDLVTCAPNTRCTTRDTCYRNVTHISAAV
jgi:hypothetical protein